MQSLGPLTFSEGLARRVAGPLSTRLVLQPLVAIILGIRDGVKDAKSGRPPYFIGLFVAGPGSIPRRELLKSSFRSIMTPLAIGIILDMVVQWYLFRRVIILAAILVGALLVAVPYTIVRGLTNRVVVNRYKRRLARTNASKPSRAA